MTSVAVKRWMTVLLALGYLPVAAYPLTLIMAFFGFAALNTAGSVSDQQQMKTLLIASLAYPVVPLVCAPLARRAFKAENWKQCLILSAVPIGLIIIPLFVVFVIETYR